MARASGAKRRHPRSGDKKDVPNTSTLSGEFSDSPSDGEGKKKAKLNPPDEMTKKESTTASHEASLTSKHEKKASRLEVSGNHSLVSGARQASRRHKRADASVAAEGNRRYLRSTSSIKQEGNVHIVCRKLTGGVMSVLMHTTRIIGSKRCQIKIGGCILIFPRHSFLVNTKVYIALEIDSSKWQGKFFACTPMLQVIAKNLQKKVRVRLPSWCISRQQQAFSRVWHMMDDSTWECTKVRIPITDKPYFEFDWDDFSCIACGIDEDSTSMEDLLLCISGGVYTSRNNEVSIVFHLDDRGACCDHAATDRCVEDLMKRMSRKFKSDLKPIEVGLDGEVSVHASLDKAALTFFSSGPFTSVVNRSFVNRGYDDHHTCIAGYKRVTSCLVLLRQFRGQDFVRELSFAYQRPGRAGTTSGSGNQAAVGRQAPSGSQDFVRELSFAYERPGRAGTTSGSGNPAALGPAMYTSVHVHGPHAQHNVDSSQVHTMHYARSGSRIRSSAMRTRYSMRGRR